MDNAYHSLPGPAELHLLHLLACFVSFAAYRPSQRKHYPSGRRLLLQVLPGMPRLELSCEALPTTLYQGEIIRVPLVLRNVGLVPAVKLKVAVTHPGVALARGTAAGGSEATVAPGHYMSGSSSSSHSTGWLGPLEAIAGMFHLSHWDVTKMQKL